MNNHIKPQWNWDGDFTWDGYFLRMHIKTINPTYDANSPHTWPLIRQVVATGDGADYSGSKFPPQYLAYDRTLVESFKRLQNQPGSSGRMKQHLKKLFLHYPFNYDRHGQLRTYPHMPTDEIEEWKKRMSLVVPNESEEAEYENTTDNDHVEKQTIQIISREVALSKIMKMVEDTNTETLSASRVPELEKGLQRLRHELSSVKYTRDAWKRRAIDLAESIRAAVNKFPERVVDELIYKEKLCKVFNQEQAYSYDLETLVELTMAAHEAAIKEHKTRSDTAKEVSTGLMRDLASRDAKLKKRDEEISSLKSELEQSNRDIFMVLEKMEQRGQAASSKKKVCEDMSEAQRKRMKTDA
ncbi:hypothetical protein ACET3X_001967 [Alternaria dauci]|uniref:Uncharacterized protein n=1 Tax=Alternaria dauci TaxID=48095 RepID=A0ABR3UZ85_9PLEO